MTIICVVVHIASMQERAGGKLVFSKAAQQGVPRLKKVIADDGYRGPPMIDFVTKSYCRQFETKVLLVSVYYMTKRLTEKRTMPYEIDPDREKSSSYA